MKHKELITILLVVLPLVACSTEVAPSTTMATVTNAPITIQPTETSAPVATSAPTLTPAPSTTSVPTSTTIPTLSPDLGLLSWQDMGGMEPQSVPLTEWCGIPVMDTALAGDVMDQAYYVYKTSSPPMAVYQYYLSEMPNLNWELYLVGTDAVNATPAETANLEEFHPTLFYQKGSFNEQGSITMLGDFTNNLIYVMILCGG